MTCPAEDSRSALPRFPLDADAPPSSRRRRPCLELVVEASESNVLAAPAAHDLFGPGEDEHSVALTHIYVPVTVDAPRDPESQRRFDEFWRARPVPAPEPASVFLPLFPMFPTVPLLQRKIVLGAILGAAALAAVALWIGIFVLLTTHVDGGAESSQVEPAESNAAAQ